MKRALLPLNALRAFDAAARHLSFKNAAEELSVTPAAVSQQVRALEEYLGVQLFKRLNRTLVLTAQANNALPALESGFKQFEIAVGELLALREENNLRISVSPSFAAKWLVPRIGSYYEQHADVVVKLSASMHLVDFSREEFDLAIRYGAGDYPDLAVEELLRESVSPVCSPELMQDDGIKSLSDLKRFTLIHDDSSLDDPSCPDWAMWLKASCVAMEDGQSALHFNQSNLAIEAAIAGRGVALAKSTIAEADIAAGRLVRPFEKVQSVDFAYYMVCPKEKLETAKVQSFMAWLRAEAGPEADKGDDA